MFVYQVCFFPALCHLWRESLTFLFQSCVFSVRDFWTVTAISFHVLVMYWPCFCSILQCFEYYFVKMYFLKIHFLLSSLYKANSTKAAPGILLEYCFA